MCHTLNIYIYNQIQCCEYSFLIKVNKDVLASLGQERDFVT